MSLRELFSDREPDLPRLYAYPDGRWLRANMVATADGAASLNGLTQGISSDTDRRVFALLRTLCDVILVGASTVREEKYKPARPQELWSHLRDGRPPTPPIAVVSRRLDLDPDSPLITAAPAHARTIVITTASAPAARRDLLARFAEVIIAGQDTVDLSHRSGRAGQTRPPPDARRGRPAPARPAGRGWPAGRAVPDHRAADGRPGARPGSWPGSPARAPSLRRCR